MADTTSIFIVPNKYGFCVKVNHPEINKLYRRYKKWKGLRADCPLTDKERLEFEQYIIDRVITPRQAK